jgi:hypothetical protein
VGGQVISNVTRYEVTCWLIRGVFTIWSVVRLEICLWQR